MACHSLHLGYDSSFLHFATQESHLQRVYADGDPEWDKNRAVNQETQTSVAKFNIPSIPNISSTARLKPTACIKTFHTVLKRDKIFFIQNFISKETPGIMYLDPPLCLL